MSGTHIECHVYQLTSYLLRYERMRSRIKPTPSPFYLPLHHFSCSLRNKSTPGQILSDMSREIMLYTQFLLINRPINTLNQVSWIIFIKALSNVEDENIEFFFSGHLENKHLNFHSVVQSRGSGSAWSFLKEDFFFFLISLLH